MLVTILLFYKMRNLGTESLRKLSEFRQLEKERGRFISEHPQCAHSTPSPGPSWLKRVLCALHLPWGPQVPLLLTWREAEREQIPWPRNLSLDYSELTKCTKWTQNRDILGLFSIFYAWAHKNMYTRHLCSKNICAHRSWFISTVIDYSMSAF